MRAGKKAVAEKIVYRGLDLVKYHFEERLNKEMSAEQREKTDSGSRGALSLEIFEQSLDNIRPTVEVRAKRVGGATFQVPIDVRMSRATALAMRWLIDAANARSEKTMEERLAAEVIDAYYNKGGAVKKREDTHRMAKSNQAYAHYRTN
jgi:small subunit ribosomal protein S7